MRFRYALPTLALVLVAWLYAHSQGGAFSQEKLSQTPISTYSALPTCAAQTKGNVATVTDSNTVTWGATIAGSSTNVVLGYCDGTNWTVAGK